ncbi:hypothetical protein SDJN02_07020, partial [Cucurbita argyrosperma subsp. argyrosperma]
MIPLLQSTGDPSEQRWSRMAADLSLVMGGRHHPHFHMLRFQRFHFVKYFHRQTDNPCFDNVDVLLCTVHTAPAEYHPEVVTTAIAATGPGIGKALVSRFELDRIKPNWPTLKEKWANPRLWGQLYPSNRAHITE